MTARIHDLRPISLGLLTGLSLLAATGCDSGGGSGGGGGGGGGGGNQPLIVDFALRTDLHLGTAFLGDVLHVDLNEDGLEDLVEANFGTKFVTIALGNADGTFTTIHQLPTMGHAWRLTTGDFDGDGMTDIAVASGDWIDGADQGVQIFAQGPNFGDFGASIDFALDTDPKDLAAAPLTGIAGDPGPDEIFVAMRDVQKVARLSLDGGGNLVETGSLDSASLGSAGGPFSVAVLDLGSDGFLDVVAGEENVLDGSSDRIVEYPRTAGGFQPAQLVFAPAFRPIVDAIGDADGNGFDDLAVAQLGDSEVLLLAADASGLSQVHALDFGGATSSLIFRDVDGDGLAEAIATVFGQSSIQVHAATGPFVWDEPVHYNVGIGPRAIGVWNLPGDSVPDLVCANAQDLSVLVGTGNGSFRCARGYATGAISPIALDTGDLDNDGDMDAVVITKGQQTLVILEGQGDGTLVARKILHLVPTTDDTTGYMALTDADGDGDLDVLVSVYESDEVRLYRNPGDLEGFSEPAPADVFPVGDGPLGLDIGDFNDDGRLDLVIGNVLGEAVQVLLGTAGGSLVPQAPIPVGISPLALRCADFDGDGHLDLAATAKDLVSLEAALLVLSGDGWGSFALEVQHALEGPLGLLEMGDVDEDADLDLVVGRAGTLEDQVSLLTNEGGFLFTPTTLNVASGPATPVLADADDDGHIDLLVPTVAGELKLLFGDGSGSFPEIVPAVKGELPTPSNTTAASFADLDGDNLPELLMVTPLSPFVWVAKNASVALQE